MHKYYTLVFVLVIILCGCTERNKSTISYNELNVCEDSVTFNFNKSILPDFFIDYGHKGFYLTDLKHNWKTSFSDDYFDVSIKYADECYVIIYCALSGIKNGYLLFPKKYRRIYLFKRENGEKIIDIKCDEPLEKSEIRNDTLYLKCYNSNVKYYKL